jgi:hypothetical protein
MMNADKQTFLTQTTPKDKHTNIRYYISREKARITKISVGDERQSFQLGKRSSKIRHGNTLLGKSSEGIMELCGEQPPNQKFPKVIKHCPK